MELLETTPIPWARGRAFKSPRPDQIEFSILRCYTRLRATQSLSANSYTRFSDRCLALACREAMREPALGLSLRTIRLLRLTRGYIERRHDGTGTVRARVLAQGIQRQCAVEMLLCLSEFCLPQE